MINYDAIPQTDWARVAAYADSEGCIQICWVRPPNRARGNHALYLDIGSIDPRLTEWLARTFGGYSKPVKRSFSKIGKRQMFYWRASAQVAEEILRRALPYMIMKREQAEVALVFRSTFVGGHNTRRLRQEIDSEREVLRHKLSALKWGGVSRIGKRMDPLESSEPASDLVQ